MYNRVRVPQIYTQCVVFEPGNLNVHTYTNNMYIGSYPSTQPVRKLNRLVVRAIFQKLSMLPESMMRRMHTRHRCCTNISTYTNVLSDT